MIKRRNSCPDNYGLISMFKREDIVQWCEDKKLKASDDDRLR
jgi:hypothetical protein